MHKFASQTLYASNRERSVSSDTFSLDSIGVQCVLKALYTPVEPMQSVNNLNNAKVHASYVNSYIFFLLLLDCIYQYPRDKQVQITS